MLEQSHHVQWQYQARMEEFKCPFALLTEPSDFQR